MDILSSSRVSPDRASRVRCVIPHGALSGALCRLGGVTTALPEAERDLRLPRAVRLSAVNSARPAVEGRPKNSPIRIGVRPRHAAPLDTVTHVGGRHGVRSQTRPRVNMPRVTAATQ